ncbi:hypothetical protein FQ087_18625 [Sporosarcina sp. ANT_H38]|uniref:hypothetical protein n=1 Tax=Sporosarcina sp. ANT_H38 TaxID=2597358 RepID=UPI0011F2B26E|nr:hypothetical protein [Sporosarcina sp. ANT_H38]KAA0944140.1 hypothetical protein FQ087_18625 [Sporosarcina sp. ANT_H38]
MEINNNQPTQELSKPKMNVWAKWGIGCLGCLGFIVILGIILGGCSLLWFATDTETDKIAVSNMTVEEIEDKKANAQTIEYPQLKKNPDKYKGEYVTYTGQIAQIIESGSRTDIRLAVTENDYGYDMGDIIYIKYVGITDFVEDDIITVYGTITGTHRYKSQANYNVDLPGLNADELIPK